MTFQNNTATLSPEETMVKTHYLQPSLNHSLQTATNATLTHQTYH